jgi:SAM-dependent methyltransferase
MRTTEEQVAAHYRRSGLLDAILDRLGAMGLGPDRVTVEDLAGVDQFHVGGHQATMDLLDQLPIGPATRVLDIGCGIGGPARTIAARFGCAVTGIDLTPDFVATAAALTRLVGLEDRVRYDAGSALDLPFAEASFDLATLLHVGMNIEDKAGICRQAWRVLRPGGSFALFEVMRTGPGELAFPLPWAAAPETSFVAPPDAYRAALEAAGFQVRATRDRGEFGLAFFREMRARMATQEAPRMTLHLLMGPEGPVRMANLLAAFEAGRLAPVELIAVKP